MRKILFLLCTSLWLTACGSGEKQTGGAGGESDSMETQVNDETGDWQDEETRGGKDDKIGDTYNDAGSETDGGTGGAEMTALAEGPYGSIQLTLPEGWAYETCPPDDERLVYGVYGVHIYPKDVSEGFVEIVYNASFGVCGTGLREEKRTIAGDTATIGYYDGSDRLSFILFGGRNKHIVAQTFETDSWWDDQQEEVMQILDTLTYDETRQSGAIGVYHAESEIEEIGLMLSAKNVTPSGAVICFYQYDDSIEDEILTGRYFRIEKKEGGTWNEPEIVVEGEYGFTSEGLIVAKADTTEIAYDWEWLYGALPAGEYRIGVHVTAGKQYDGYAHFVIR